LPTYPNALRALSSTEPYSHAHWARCTTRIELHESALAVCDDIVGVAVAFVVASAAVKGIAARRVLRAESIRTPASKEQIDSSSVEQIVVTPPSLEDIVPTVAFQAIATAIAEKQVIVLTTPKALDTDEGVGAISSRGPRRQTRGDPHRRTHIERIRLTVSNAVVEYPGAISAPVHMIVSRAAPETVWASAAEKAVVSFAPK